MAKAAKRGSFKTTVGGQAVLEGIMMRGPQKWCLAVRKPDGEVACEVHDVKKRAWTHWPFIRGVLSFVDSLMMGYKTLMRSAEIAMTEEERAEEPSKFDKWVDRHFGEAGGKVVMGVSAVLGIALALGLFMFLPTLLVSLLNDYVTPLYWGKPVLEGVLKMALFVGYLALVGRMKEIRRVFSYHGAEHKTIYCYEAGDALSVENIRGHSRFHPRCGTSFLFIVLFLSILLNSALPWPELAGGAVLRTGLKLLMLPVVMALSYEVIRLAGRYDNPLTRAVSAPGMWIQRLTTKEPDDSMIEVAILAVGPVLPQAPEEAKW